MTQARNTKCVWQPRVSRAVLCSIVILLFISASLAQNSAACVIDQPLPSLPEDYGTLDAETSVIFRVEFLSSGTLGKIGLVKSSQINRLDKLATEAVNKIRFKPKQGNGEPVTTYEIFAYRYSWRIGGWRAERRKHLKVCQGGKN